MAKKAGKEQEVSPEVEMQRQRTQLMAQRAEKLRRRVQGSETTTFNKENLDVLKEARAAAAKMGYELGEWVQSENPEIYNAWCRQTGLNAYAGWQTVVNQKGKKSLTPVWGGEVFRRPRAAYKGGPTGLYNAIRG